MSIAKSCAKKIRYIWLYVRYYHKMANVGKHTVMFKPIRIMGGKNISIGDYTYIMEGLRIEAIERFNDQKFQPRIKIGDRVEIGQHCHISCCSEIVLENDVTLAPHVMVNDTSHGYKDLGMPIERQDLATKPIKIGEGSLIGYGAVILPGVTIGKHCFIGAYSIISKDIADNTIVSNHSNLVEKTIE